MPSPTEIPISSGDSIDLMAGVLRFLRSVRSRLYLVILALIGSLSLGAFYYVSAERKYESSAKLLILQTGGDSLEKDGNKSQGLQDKMPEFVELLTCDSTLKETLRNLPDDHRIDLAGVRQDKWLLAFRSKLSVGTVRKTNIMTVAFRSKDPTTAYAVVDEVLTSFMAEVNRMHQDEASVDLKLLTQQRDSVERDLLAKLKEQRELESQTTDLFGNGDKEINILTARIEKLNQDWLSLSKTANESQALLDEMEAALARGEDLSKYMNRIDPALASKINEKRTGTDVAESYAATRMQQELTQAQSLLQEKLAFLGENHPEIQRIRNEIVIKERQLLGRPQAVNQLLDSQDIGATLLQTVRRDTAIATKQVERARETLDREKVQASKQNGLYADIAAKKQEVTRFQDYLAVLSDRMKSTRLGQSNSIRAKITVDPEINMSPVTPRLTMTVFVCVLLGIGSSFSLIYILDLVDDRFRSPDDLRRELGAPVLAMIRKLPVLGDHGLSSLYPFAKPNAIESEAFRTLRTAIAFSGEESRRLTISSTEPGDGKTTVLASLAVAFAQSGKRTLVIDGDMRRPGLSKLFEYSGREGLSTILKEGLPVPDVAARVVIPTELSNLHVIASGPRPINPVELLAGERLAELIAWADTHYDQILIDAPPSLAVADVQLIGRLVDGAILTVRPDTNRRRMVIRAAESLTALGCPLMGIVVNQLQNKSGDEYGYGYGYGYGSKAGGYGYGHDNEQEPRHEEQPSDESVDTVPLRKAA